jgi:hypothetical protein
MRTLVITSFITVMIAIVFGCGPSKEQIARRNAINEQSQIEKNQKQLAIKSRQDTLRAQKQHRIEASEKVPTRVEDPGYAIVICENVKEDIARPWIELPPNIKMICGNTIQGNQIIAYRQWYCENDIDKSCIYGIWKDDEPQFDPGWSVWGEATHTINGMTFRTRAY